MPLKSALFLDFQSCTLSDHLLIKRKSNLVILTTLLFKILFFFFEFFVIKSVTVFYTLTASFVNPAYDFLEL